MKLSARCKRTRRNIAHGRQVALFLHKSEPLLQVAGNWPSSPWYLGVGVMGRSVPTVVPMVPNRSCQAKFEATNGGEAPTLRFLLAAVLVGECDHLDFQGKGSRL